MSLLSPVVPRSLAPTTGVVESLGVKYTMFQAAGAQPDGDLGSVAPGITAPLGSDRVYALGVPHASAWHAALHNIG